MPRDREDTAAVSAPAVGCEKKEKQEKRVSKGSPPMTSGVIAAQKNSTSTRSARRRRDSGSSDCRTDSAAPPGDATDSSDQKREDCDAYRGNQAPGRREKTTRHERPKPKAGGESAAPVPEASAIMAAGGVLFADECIYSIENTSKLACSQEEQSSDGEGGRDGRWPPPAQLEDLTPATVVASAKHRGGGGEENRSGSSSSSNRNSSSNNNSSSSDSPRCSSASSSTASSSCAATTPAKKETQLQSQKFRSPMISHRRKTRGATNISVDKSLSATKAPPVELGSTTKRRKRRRPSDPLPANDSGGGDAPPQDKTGSIITRGDTAKADPVISCPNARSSLARNEAPEAPTSQHPEPVVHGGSNNVGERPKHKNIHEQSEEERASTRPAEPAAYDHPQGTVAANVAQRSNPVRRNDRVRRPRQESAQEINTGSADAKGGLQRHQQSPDERRGRSQGATVEATGDRSAALDVQVINRGTTKHLVLTTVDDAIGGDPGAGDRPRGAAHLLVPRNDCRSSQAIGSRRHEHQPRASDPAEKKRRTVVRGKLPTAAVTPRVDSSAKGDSITAPFRGAEQEQPVTARQVDVEGGRTPQTPPPKRPPAMPAKQPLPPEKHPFATESSGAGPLQTAVAASPCRASDIAPVFSVGERVSPQASPPRPAALPQNMYLAGDPRGASPTSSDASSFSGELTVERTTKYVQQQASFHADGSEDFINETSSEEESGSPASPRRAVLEIASSSMDAVDTTVAASTVSNARTHGGGWVKVEERRGGAKAAPSPPPPMSWGNGARESRRRRQAGAKTRRVLSFPNENGHPESPCPQARSESLGGAPLGVHPPTASVDGEALAKNGDRQAHNPEDKDTASPSFPKWSDSGGRQLGPPRSVEARSDVGGSGGDLLHFRADFSRHLLSGGRPALFFLRPNESLAVTRIEGDGRLLVTLRDEAGAAGVVVDGAVVHDSAAHFGHAAIQTDHRFPYVSGHRYEFHVVPGVGLAVNAENTQSTADSGRSTAATPIGLEVVFSVMSAYNEEARLCDADARRLSLPAFQAPACLPPKPAPTETTGSTSTVTSFARDTSNIRRSSQDNSRPDCQPPPVGVAAAPTGPCVHPPSIVKPADSVTQLSSITPTPSESAKTVASRPPARSFQNRATPGVGSGGVEETVPGQHPLKAPPHGKLGDHSTRRGPAGKNQFGFEVEREYSNKQELDTPTRGRGSRLRPPVATESGGNIVGAYSDGVERRQVSNERYATVSASAVDRYAPKGSNQLLGPLTDVEVDYPRRKVEAPDVTGGHSTERLRWNPAWEHQSPSPKEPVPNQSSLPYIRQQGEPQPALGHLDSGSNRTTRDVNARDRSVRPPPHCAESTQRKRHTAGAEGEGAHYGPRPTHQAHRDTTAAYRNHPQRDYPHREHIATLPDRRRFDYEKRRVFSPQDGSSSAGEGGGRGIVTPDGRWDYRLRQHPVEGKRLAPDRNPSDLSRGRRYDRRASEGGEPRADRRGWREDESLTAGNTHDLRRKTSRDSVATDGDVNRWTRRIPEKDPRPYEYQVHDQRAAAAPAYESGRGDALQLSEASRWDGEPPRDPWRGARNSRGSGEHAMGFTAEAFEGKRRGYPQVRRAVENPRAQRGGEEARYGRESMERKRTPRQHPAHQTGTELSTYRKPRRGVGSNVAQIGGHGGSSDRTPPRWNKF